MGRQKVGDENIRKLIQLGENSIAVTLPIGMVRDLKWKGKQKVTVTKSGKQIVIQDWKGK